MAASAASSIPQIAIDFSRPGQQLLPAYVVKLLKTLKIPHGTDRSMQGGDRDPTVELIKHVIDCLGALREVNKIYRGKGSLASRSIGARAMFGFTAELGNLLLDAITFSPPAEFVESASHYSHIANHILNVFPEIAAQVTKDTGKMLIHHVALKASPVMALDAVKMVLTAFPGGSQAQDSSGALPLHWITHNSTASFDMVSLLISAYPKATIVADIDGYLPLHWAVNQDNPNMEVVAALLAANVLAASKPCSKGSLPLHWCVNRERPSIPVVEALLQAHPDAVRTFNDDGWLPVHHCVDRSDVCEEVLQTLIDIYPQGLQCPNSDGQLPIHRALDHPSPNIVAVKLMIKAFPGCCQVSDDEGYLPLHLALDCAQPSITVVKLLIDEYPAAAQRKSRDGLLPLHCVCSCVNPSVEVIKMLLDLFPDGPEHAAVDVVPLDEDADPDSWQGEWVKKRWTPMSRCIGRKLNTVVNMMKESLKKKSNSLGGPLRIIEPPSVKGVFMPMGMDSKNDSESEDGFRAPPSDRSSDTREDRHQRSHRDHRERRHHGSSRDKDRDRDRDTSHSRHRHSKDRDSRSRHHRYRDDRGDRRKDSDSGDSSRIPGRGRGGRGSETDDQSGDEKSSPTVVRGIEPSQAPPREMQRAFERSADKHQTTPSKSGEVVIPLKDLELSDDEEEVARIIGRDKHKKIIPRQQVFSGDEMV
jgi:ankyrin repeat protein